MALARRLAAPLEILISPCTTFLAPPGSNFRFPLVSLKIVFSENMFFRFGASSDPSFEALGRLQPPFWDHLGTQNGTFLDANMISAKTVILAIFGDQFFKTNSPSPTAC